MAAVADAADAAKLVFTTLPWNGCESFATPRPYFERLSRDAARLDISWPQDLPEQLQRSLKESLKQKPAGPWGSNWPSPVGLLRVELTRQGEVRTALRALPAAPEGPWKAISSPAPWFGRCTGTKHGAWVAYRNATAEARSKNAEVALFFDGETLVDGDRCAVLLRAAKSAKDAAFLMPNEAETVPSVSCLATLPAAFWRRASGITRQQLLEAEEVLVVGSGVGLRRVSHLDGHPLKCSDDSGYRRFLAAMEATRENRWCSLEETVAAAAASTMSSRWSWDVGADDQMMPVLAEQLRRSQLWGECSGPWAPDQLLLHSGGPVTDVASSSLLAGPPVLRFVVKQPEVQSARTPSRSSSSPLQGQLPLLRSEDRLPLTWQPQQFAFGRWQALPELPVHRRLGPALRQVALCARQILSDWLWTSEAAAEENSLPVRGSSLAGLLAYDLVQWTQPLALEHPPEPAALLGALYRVDRWLIHQRSTGKLHLLAPPGDPWAMQVAECMDSLLQDCRAHVSPRTAELTLAPQACYTSSIDDETHIDAVKQVQDAIRNGQFYQLNFGRSWQGELRESPWQLMQKLFMYNAAPYSGFLQLQVDGLRSALCSCSPELLLSAKGGKLCTCPIKGTCARSMDATEDQQMRQEMVASQKEVAEHMMLVDLERHDLGYASIASSVAWDRWRVEAFPNIQHMVSKVSGRLCPSSDVWAALEAVFPGGSITGCPKTATIAAIDALEKEPRRGWTGSLGFADLLTGDGQWNILIRTLEAEAEDHSWRAVVKAGGGLTIGSDPAAEVQEAKLKAARILQLAFSGGSAMAAPQKRVSQEPSSSRSSVCRQAEVAQQIAVQDVASAQSGRLEGLLKAFASQREGPGGSGGSACGSWRMWSPQAWPEFRGNATRVLFVDNLDSFSLNVANALTKLGAEVLMVQGRGPTSPTVEEVLSVRPSHLVLGPGPGRPEMSSLTMALAHLALAGRLPPLLGLCLGHQALGVAEGWRLSPSPLGPCHGVTEEIWHHQRGIFSHLETPARMMRYNSLVLEPPAASRGLQVCAWDASRQLVMALERPDVQVYGVQFHPESAGSYQGDQLLRSFLTLRRSAL